MRLLSGLPGDPAAGSGMTWGQKGAWDCTGGSSQTFHSGVQSLLPSPPPSPMGFALHISPRPSQAFTQTCQVWLGVGGRHLSLPTRSESSPLISPDHRALKPNTNPGGLERREGPGAGRNMFQSGLGVGEGALSAWLGSLGTPVLGPLGLCQDAPPGLANPW